jgi:hypothetical protein
MINFDSTHIFIGYLKQLLSTFNLPTCKVYTNEFAKYFNQNGKEDPRVLESFDTLGSNRLAVRVNYLKDDSITNYFWSKNDNENSGCSWQKCSTAFYDKAKATRGLTRTLHSPGILYDTVTHEYLGDFLRFIRDYYDVNLMSLYNCFNNKICNNLYFNNSGLSTKEDAPQIFFDSRDIKYHIYAIPVKLFSKYTIAIDCNQSIEIFCGLYNTRLDNSDRNVDLVTKTYKKVNGTIFRQPFLYDKLSAEYWSVDITNVSKNNTLEKQLNNSKIISKWDIANREQDLKLFLKIPATCKSSIVILEGDYRSFNDTKYSQVMLKADGTPFNQDTDDISLLDKTFWRYEQNHSALNFEDKNTLDDNFRPISKLQLLAFNVNRSYPFADRLIEYLSGSAITPIDKISDNIKRVQKVMEQNNYYFKIKGLWENKMQKIIYDYIINSGPIELNSLGSITDRHQGLNPSQYGYHPRLGHTSKSTLYDVLGYVDKEAEKWYSSWKKDKESNKLIVQDNIQNVDIYNGLFDK